MPEPAVTRSRRGRMSRSARRAQLLDAALDTFAAQGFHAAAMDDIADCAGVSKPVLYQHFPSKLALYLALLDKSCEAVIDAVRAALDSTEDNNERVTATMQAFYTYVASDKAAFRLVFESDLTSQPSVRERIEHVTSQTAAAIATVIGDDTGLPKAQSELLAVSLVGMAHVSARFLVSTDHPIDQAEAVALVSTLAWRGISRYPRADGAGGSSGR